jgi:hypothetical protein
VAIENRMDGADRWRMHIGIEPRQSFPDLRRAPTRLVLLQPDDLCLDLEGQLIGVAKAGASGQ